MRLRCASFNVLADAYLSYGDYRHADPALFLPGARVDLLISLINSLRVDIIALQEAEMPLVAKVQAGTAWQEFWSPKGFHKPDGCLTLVRPGLSVTDFQTHYYTDGSGHMVQLLDIQGATYANTHIEWAPADQPDHPGVYQTRELLACLGPTRAAVILTDSNDRPGGPIRAMVAAAGFTNTCGTKPTALIGTEQAALDLLAVRGLQARPIKTKFRPHGIPNAACPSDHIPVLASIETG